MMALANLAGGAGAYLPMLHATDAAEVIVHQAVAERTLKLRSERETAHIKNIGAYIEALARMMGRIFSG